MSDLIKRLRNRAIKKEPKCDLHDPLLIEAADRIEELEELAVYYKCCALSGEIPIIHQHRSNYMGAEYPEEWPEIRKEIELMVED